MAHVLRLPQVDLSTVLSQQNPSIDLRVHVYENSTRNFLKALASYKNRAITTIADRRKGQATEKKKIHDKSQAVDSETNQCKMKEIELVAQLEREKEERKDAELEVAGFKRQLGSLREKHASIQTDIEHYRALTQNLRREKNKEQSLLGAHASQVFPPLDACETRLSCVVEGVDNNRLLVRFSNVDRNERTREASFVLHLSPHFFKVITSSPQLPSMPILVNTLNDTGDIYMFIKVARTGYEALVRRFKCVTSLICSFVTSLKVPLQDFIMVGRWEMWE